MHKCNCQDNCKHSYLVNGCTYTRNNCGCKTSKINNCCCNKGCCDIDNSTTIVNRSTVINNHHDKHKPIGYHHHHVKQCCNDLNGYCGCSEKQTKTAVCLKPSLVCFETVENVKRAVIKEGTQGVVLGKFNGQYYSLSSGDEVVVELVGNADAQTCGLHTLLINGVEATGNDIYNEAIEIVTGSCECPTYTNTNTFTGTNDISITCDTKVEFYHVTGE
jgi:hypothetical protein